MSLYLVTYTVEAMVEADSQADAVDLMQHDHVGWTDEVYNGTATAHEVDHLQAVPREWHDSIPYGGDHRRTVRQILREEVSP